MERKQGIHINDNYTNFTNLSEFRVDVEAEMAEVDKLLGDFGSNFSPSYNNHQSYPPNQTNNPGYIEVNDHYTNFTNLSEFRVDVAAEMDEVDRLLGDTSSMNNSSRMANDGFAQNNTYTPNMPANHQSNLPPVNNEVGMLQMQVKSLQNEVQYLNTKLDRVAQMLSLLLQKGDL